MANIATWNFKVNGQKEEVQTIQLESTCNNKTLVDNKIAPGTSGTFNIIVDGTDSDVGINYKIEIANGKNKPTNLNFIYDGKKYNSISELATNLSGTIYAKDENKVKTITINWEWPYETGSNTNQIAYHDKLDTQDAQNMAIYTFNVIVSGTQILPQS